MEKRPLIVKSNPYAQYPAGILPGNEHLFKQNLSFSFIVSKLFFFFQYSSSQGYGTIFYGAGVKRLQNIMFSNWHPAHTNKSDVELQRDGQCVRCLNYPPKQRRKVRLRGKEPVWEGQERVLSQIRW